MPPPISTSAHKLFTAEEIVAQPAGFLREIIRALCVDDSVRTRASILLSKLQDGGQEQLQSDIPKETRHLEEADEGVPPGKRLKLEDKTDTTQDAITGASGAAIITGTSRASTFGTPQKTRPDPKTLPEGKKVCIKCKEEYWEDKNWPRSCWFHDGYLDLNSEHEVWEGMDYDDLAEIDTEEMREEAPQGFTYLCCGETGLSKGCKWGTHSSTRDPPVATKRVLEVSDLTKSNLEESTKPKGPSRGVEAETEEEAGKTRLDDKIYAWMNH